ncbi:MAG: CHRD domain-containing protein [Acidobacteriota bacterium]|nr:CHRD domain-containing protein [Acidobacteriota bacterium]
MPISIPSIFSPLSHRKTSKRSVAIQFAAILFGFIFFAHLSVFADTTFTSDINGIQATPVNSSSAAGVGTVILNTAETQVTVTIYVAGLSGAQTAANIHGPAPRGRTAAAIFTLPGGNFTQVFPVTAIQAANLKAGLWYFNIRTSVYPGGEIRGQIDALAAPGLAGLAGWYRGEANAFDTSVNGNNGTLRNGAGFGIGKIGHAFNFDGVNDYVEISDSPSLDITERISVQAWIYPTSVLSGKIIDKQTSGGNDGYSFEISNRKLRLRVGSESFQNQAELSTNIWTHVAATYDGARIRIYINGVLNSISDELIGSFPANSVPLRIGTDSTTSANFFGGMIDEVQIHNRALSASEIKAVYGSIPFPFSNGTPDTTFDSDGIVISQMAGAVNIAQAVAVQPDGRIVVAGINSNGSNNDFVIMRYYPNGTLDDTFDGANNGNGIVITPIGSGDEEAYGLVIQPDGKIIVAGRTSNGSNTDFAVVRYNTNGTLDATFDGDGIAITPIGSGSETARSVAVQPDGKIVVAGYSVVGSNNDFAVVRYESNGSLDSTFDGNSGAGNGVVTTAVGTGQEFGYGVAIQMDGKIVVSGYYFNGPTTDTAILRYDQNGILDTSFDFDGIVTSAFSPETDEAFALALQPDGRIVIAGCIRNGSPNDFLLARYNHNGSLDLSFGTNGSTVVAIGPGADIALGVAIQSDGKIVAAGFSNNGSNNDFAVVRTNPDGTLDTSFDGDGRLTTALGPGSDSANSVAIQADGKIIAVGRTIIESITGFGIVRYGYGTNPLANDGFFALNRTTAVRFGNGFRSGTTVSTPISILGLPTLPSGVSLLNMPREILTTAGFTDDIQVKITLPASVGLSSFNAAQILQFENGMWADRTSAIPQRDFATRTIYARVSMFSPFAVVSTLPPAAAFVSVTGRLLRADGRGHHNAIVTITDGNGERISAVTNPFGYYRFKNVAARGVYLMNFSAKRRAFPPSILSTPEDIEDLDFVAEN